MLAALVLLVVLFVVLAREPLRERLRDGRQPAAPVRPSGVPPAPVIPP
jgi:hypothetical protein